MKNKKLAYVLLPVVLVVWGIVGYKLYVKFFGEENNLVTGNEIVVQGESNASTDHFDIANNYRDPFLGNKVREAVVKSEAATVVTQAPVQVAPQPVIKPAVFWPPIVVGGVVNEKKFMGLISGKNVLLEKGEEAYGVTFIKSSKDSVWLKFSNQQRSFPLKLR